MVFEVDLGDAFGEFVAARDADFLAAGDAFSGSPKEVFRKLHLLPADAVDAKVGGSTVHGYVLLSQEGFCAD